MNILLFAGTSEGRILAEEISRFPVRLTVCVATGYGAAMLEGIRQSFNLHQGRMNSFEIAEFIHKNNYDFVIDATHPYAMEAGVNIKNACNENNIELVRVGRKESHGQEGCIFVTSAQEAASHLAGSQGNILLTTGSKDLAAYTNIPDFANRIYPRVLPTCDAINKCLVLGYKASNIIAMHGPFSKELNTAIIRQFNIKTLVTKDSGSRGGFYEKIDAARECSAGLIVLGRPPCREGFSLQQVIDTVRERLVRT